MKPERQFSQLIRPHHVSFRSSRHNDATHHTLISASDLNHSPLAYFGQADLGSDRRRQRLTALTATTNGQNYAALDLDRETTSPLITFGQVYVRQGASAPSGLFSIRVESIGVRERGGGRLAVDEGEEYDENYAALDLGQEYVGRSFGTAAPGTTSPLITFGQVYVAQGFAPPGFSLSESTGGFDRRSRVEERRVEWWNWSSVGVRVGGEASRVVELVFGRHSNCRVDADLTRWMLGAGAVAEMERSAGGDSRRDGDCRADADLTRWMLGAGAVAEMERSAGGDSRRDGGEHSWISSDFRTTSPLITFGYCRVDADLMDGSGCGG
ncbi:hypothetical protein BDZ88DRAFT_455504 [Geranomyces variabilis]|nr:hypothetical protein BDZ88DRAFT_455504 [Geranomyces variabilis]